MTIHVRLFAMMAQHLGRPALALELPSDSRLSKVQHALQAQFPKPPWPSGTLLAINQEYAAADTVLRDGDEVAIIPPVSGG